MPQGVYRGKGKHKTSLGYVYFILDRLTGNYGIYRYLIRMLSDFGLDYNKLRRSGWMDTEHYDDGRYYIVGCLLNMRGSKDTFDRGQGLKTLYRNARHSNILQQRGEDIYRNRFKDIDKEKK